MSINENNYGTTNLAANESKQLEKSIFNDFSDMLNYYRKEKEKYKINLANKVNLYGEKVKLLKKISVYALKIELINERIKNRSK
jgi:hypothetical protein